MPLLAGSPTNGVLSLLAWELTIELQNRLCMRLSVLEQSGLPVLVYDIWPESKMHAERIISSTSKAYSLAGRYAPSGLLYDSNASMPKATAAGGPGLAAVERSSPLLACRHTSQCPQAITVRTARGYSAAQAGDNMQEAASLSRLTKDQGSHRPGLDRIKQALAEDRQSGSFPGSPSEVAALEDPARGPEA